MGAVAGIHRAVMTINFDPPPHNRNDRDARPVTADAVSRRMTTQHQKTSAAGPHVVAMGCRLNGYEADQMHHLAREAGMGEAVIINSCAVTNEAVRQTRQKIRKLAQKNTGRALIVTGCAAQLDPQAFSDMPEVSGVLGNEIKLDPEAWKHLSSGTVPVVHTDIMAARTIKKSSHSPALQQSRARAYVQIQTGCDHRCTFCIIPFGRGNSRSILPDDIINEVHGLVEEGYKEVVLTGVDITSYGDDFAVPVSLGDIVQKILTEVPRLYRLRLSSIDGAEIDDALFELITTQSRIAPHLHLSMQSGDDMILKRMKRRHTRKGAISFCKRVKACRADIALGADIIAGFPTETEAMFENSLSLIEACGLSYVHVFPFSPRDGTPAARMPQVERAIVKARAARLRAASSEALSRHLQYKVGGMYTALIEKSGANGVISGRLADFSQICVEPTLEDTAIARGSHMHPGALISVQITHADERVLYGEIRQ